MAQDGASELGEEALDEVEPRAVLGREGELEAPAWSSSEPGSGFSRDVRGMIVEDQLDRGAPRISGIEKSEEFYELAAAVAVSDESVDLAGEQINPGQQAGVPCRLYSWSRAKLAWTPGSGGKSGAVVAMAWIPGFSSHDTIATGFPRLFDLAGAFFRTATSR